MLHYHISRYRRAFATAYFLRLHPEVTPGEREYDLLDGLGVTVR